MTDNTKMREAFEKWLDKGNHCGCNENMWKAWQAAQSVPAKPDYPVTQLQRLKSLMGRLGLATDESLESFCLDADRQLSRAITAMDKALESMLASQSVPVVGNVIGYLAGGTMMRRQIQGYECKPLVVQPTTSITEAELERLRKDAESYRRLVSESKKMGMQECTYPECICPDGVSSGACNLGLPDAAIAAEGEKK